jgi:hypothetical protein
VIANRAEITGVQDSLSKHNNKYEDYSPDEVDRIIINHYIEKISDLDMEDQDEPDEVANVMGVRYDLCTCYYSLSSRRERTYGHLFVKIECYLLRLRLR